MDGVTSRRLLKDPASGSVITASSGETVEIELTCANTEQKVVVFSAAAEGLGAWISEVKPLPVVPFESGPLRVWVTVGKDAQEGDYPFTVKLLCDDEVVEASAVLSLVLRVVSSGAPSVEKAVVEAVATKEQGSAEVGEQESKGTEEEPGPAIPKIEPKVVTLQPETEEEEEPEPDFAADRVVTNPAEGTILSARPGETILVRFEVKNEQAGVRTYVLQEDRSLPSEWIALVRDQVNITPGGTGDLAFALRLPTSAEPTSYPFTVSHGILGKPLVPCYLTLTVLPTPAIKLDVPKPKVTRGPFGRDVPFDISVATAGNSDTAYRIAVVAEHEAAVGEMYETPSWMYLFDKEIENIESPSAGRTPPPVPHKLTVRRKGVWWLGWRETHWLKVAAVPVTDATNGGKPGNVAELAASRWRLLPLPGFLMVPLAFVALVLLGSGGSNFRVRNGHIGEDGAYYVLGTQPNQETLDVRLAWDAPFYALLRLDKVDQGKVSSVGKSRESATDPARVVQYGQAQRVSYELRPWLFGNGTKADVRLVPLRSQEMLRLSVGGQPFRGVSGGATLGEDRVPVATYDVTINAPTSIGFRNLTGVGGIDGRTIVVWTVKQPTGFRINNFLTAPGDNQVINPGATPTARITVDPATLPEGGESTWEMLTTDGAYRLLRIRLKAVGP